MDKIHAAYSEKNRSDQHKCLFYIYRKYLPIWVIDSSDLE